MYSKDFEISKSSILDTWLYVEDEKCTFVVQCLKNGAIKTQFLLVLDPHRTDRDCGGFNHSPPAF